MIDKEAAQRAAAEQAARQAAEQAAQQSNPAQPGQQDEAGKPGEPGKGQPGKAQPGEAGQPGEPGQSGQQPGKPGDGKPGEPGKGQQGQQGEGQQPGQPGDAKSGGGKGQPDSSAQQMAKAAKSLQNAARSALPNQFSPGQLSSDPGAAGDPKSEGNVSEFDGQDPNVTRRKGTGRVWGRLQDDLDADVSDAGKEVMDHEYSELIRRYRRDLARAGQESDRKPDVGKP